MHKKEVNQFQKNRLWTAMCLVLALTFLGCQKDDPAKAVSNVANDPALQGTFTSECMSIDLDVIAEILDGSERDMLQFQGSKFTKVQTFYTEENCQKPALEIRYTGSFDVDADAFPNKPSGEININTEKLELIPKNETMVKALNTVKFCDISNYALDKETKVSNFGSLCLLEEAPKAYYGAYQVKDDTLLLDHTSVFEMATEESARKTDLDPNKPYRRN